jgi:hypothetical protein
VSIQVLVGLRRVSIYLIAEEAATDVYLLTSHDDNLLAGQDLLRDYRS